MATKKVKPRILLVDFDIVLFQFSYLHEHLIDWGDGTSSVITEPEKAKHAILSFIDRLQTRCSCDKVKLCMTGSFNFRYSVLPTYKHNRQDVQKPSLMGALKRWIADESGEEILEIKGVEADDVMGIYGSKFKNTVVATIDKDLKQIPCTLHLWNRGTIEKVSKRDADWWFYRQIITGDSTDGYTGVPNFGKAKAETFLENTPRKDWWKAILKLYENALEKAQVGHCNLKLALSTRIKHWKTLELYDEAGSVEAYALSQARVARILRAEDFNFKQEKPILWQP